jgi:hypothetical protein
VVLKGTSRARRVSKTFARSRASPGETATRNRDASIPATCRLAEPERGLNGVVISVMSAEMPAPMTTPHHHYGRNCPDETSKATTATIINKSPRASLQLTHELGGYIRQMRSRAPTENPKNTSNSKIHQLSMSATP